MDSSGSICDNQGSVITCDNWETIKEFTLELVKLLLASSNPENRGRISIIRFSLHAHIDIDLLDFEEFTPELEEKIRNLEYANSWTNTPAALDAAGLFIFTNSGGDRPDSEAKDVVIIITDGKPRLSNVSGEDIVAETITAAEALKDSGVTIYSIGVTYTGVTDYVSESVLKEMSSPPQEINQNYWKARDFDALQTVLVDLSSSFCPGECPYRVSVLIG